MKAFIHIGSEKTGTTSVQNFCAGNRGLLLQSGILYPACVGSPNQTKLTAYCLGERKIDDLRRDLGMFNSDDVQSFRSELRDALSSEIHNAPNITTLLFSNEHLQSRLLTVPEVKRLQEFISMFAQEIKILVYLRRQDNVAVSYYSTRLKAGSIESEPVFPLMAEGEPLPRYYDYNRMVELYERVFGTENIIVRVYEPRRLVGGMLLDDFKHACAIPEDERFVDPRRRNESLSEAGLAFFRRLNETVPRFIDGRPNPIRGEIVGLASRYLVGPGPKADRREAEVFYSAFQDGNRAIAERFFPKWNGKLFDEDFSNHDSREAASIDPTELIDMAIQIWIDRNRRIDEIQLTHSLARFKAKSSQAPDGNAELGVDHVNPTLPRDLLCKYVGALLFAHHFKRAADEAAEIVKDMKVPGVFVLARGLALARLGDEQGLEELIAASANHGRLPKALGELREGPLRYAPRPGWINALKSGGGLQRDLYTQCLKWLA